MIRWAAMIFYIITKTYFCEELLVFRFPFINGPEFKVMPSRSLPPLAILSNPFWCLTLRLDAVTVVTLCEEVAKAAGTDAVVDDEEGDECWSISIWLSSTSNT